MDDRLTLQKMQKTYEIHSKQDDVNFARQDKRAEKHEELMKINGDHLSHLRCDLNITMNEVQEIKKGQEETNKKIDLLVEKFEAHTKIVEPLLQNFQDNNSFWRVMKKWSTNLALPAGIIASYYAIKGFFK